MCSCTSKTRKSQKSAGTMAPQTWSLRLLT
uniref:Uncharacterized protein n=1 Tax=Anguilla anguilla TaxID=7936 RepID=A0A0E9R5P4_ANGAN